MNLDIVNLELQSASEHDREVEINLLYREFIDSLLKNFYEEVFADSEWDLV